MRLGGTLMNQNDQSAQHYDGTLAVLYLVQP